MMTRPARFTRRAALALSGGAVLGAALPRPALAQSAGQARGLVDQAVAEINAAIASRQSEAALLNDFQRIFERYADTAYLAAYALGVDGRSASNAQKSAFAEAFGYYLSRKYGRRFLEFIGGEIIVNDTRPKDSFMEVRCTTVLRGEPPFQTDFWVSDRPGRPVFFNLIIEGVNMLLSERTEIGAMLDRRGGDLDALIRDLRAT